MAHHEHDGHDGKHEHMGGKHHKGGGHMGKKEHGFGASLGKMKKEKASMEGPHSKGMHHK